MFDWLKKKKQAPALDSLPTGWGLWSVCQGNLDGMPTLVSILTEDSVVSHPALPQRMGIAMEHRVIEGRPQVSDPVYSEIEDRMLELVEGPPRQGVFALRIRNQRMIEWVSYVTSEPMARHIAETVMESFPDLRLSGMSEQDSNWDLYKLMAGLRRQ